MVRKILKNKPLVEAIFEVKWELQEQKPEIRIDPHYKLLIGRIYDKVNSEYPFHEQLPTASMPDEIAPYVVQHRFRKEKDKWPLIQMGPGIMTLNDTDNYVWEDFEKRVETVVDTLFQLYPESKDNLKVTGLMLRYIDAIEFDYGAGKIFDLLKNEMKTSLDLHKELFEGTGVDESPIAFSLGFSFPSTKPKGAVRLRFSRGKKKNLDALIWETMVQSIGDDAPTARDGIIEWIKEAHSLVNDWFFKIIAGNLEKRFE